ncbi:unnamed protein product, partial [Didymodactylos carnosus]
LVWLGQNVYHSDECQQTIAKLRKISLHLRLFNDENECYNYITSVECTKQIIMIATDSMGKTIVPKINELPQILSIYVYCFSTHTHLEWASNFSYVICGVYDDINELYEKVPKDIYSYTVDLMTVEEKNSEWLTRIQYMHSIYG